MSTFYNAKIAPLSGFAVRGFLYYQGEANNWYPKQFATLLNAMVHDFSATFGSPEQTLPFICVHIAPHNAQLIDGNKYSGLPNERWAGINESIDKVYQQNKGSFVQVPIYDIPTLAEPAAFRNEKDPARRTLTSTGADHPIHPITKRQVGERCAEAALGLLYGKQVAYLAPTVRQVTVQDGAVQVQFDNAGAGLKLTDDVGVLRGFSLCGRDGVYVPADARVVSADTVEVSSPFLSQPQNVRYAYTSVNGKANLCNSDGMPAVPFRRDKKTDVLDNKDWAFCDDTQTWVDTGMFFEYGSLDGLLSRVTDSVYLPMTLRGSGSFDAFVSAPLSGGTGTFAVRQLPDGTRCVAYRYAASEDGTAGFGPVLQYPSQNNSFCGLRYISIDLAAADGRSKAVQALRLQDYEGSRYTAAPVGETALPGDGTYYTFTFDLNTLADAQGAVLTDAQRRALLDRVQQLQFTLTDDQAGEVNLNNIRFGLAESDRLPAYHTAQTLPEEAKQTTPGWLLPAGIAAAALAAAGAALLAIRRLRKKKNK